jgi:hypothetical protein
MYVLIENDSVVQYPYSVTDLRRAHRSVSFPRIVTDETLLSYGVHRVFFTTPPEVGPTEALVEQEPVFDTGAGRWTQVFTVRTKTEEELQLETEQQAEAVRYERNAALSDSDWTQVLDAPVDQAAWATYRQALRDIPAQTGFPNEVTWPVAP